jgi:hypothetical protein
MDIFTGGRDCMWTRLITLYFLETHVNIVLTFVYVIEVESSSRVFRWACMHFYASTSCYTPYSSHLQLPDYCYDTCWIIQIMRFSVMQFSLSYYFFLPSFSCMCSHQHPHFLSCRCGEGYANQQVNYSPNPTCFSTEVHIFSRNLGAISEF